MNTLSWLIYAAEVSERASVLCGFLAFVWFLVALVGVGITFICAYDNNYGHGPILSKWVPWTAFVSALLFEMALLFGAVALPSSKTIYMIAASEAGETVVTSPDAIEMMSDLKAIIKKRLKDELETE